MSGQSIWNRTYECMDREQLRLLQQERFLQSIARVYHNVPFYREKMQKAGLSLSDIKSLEDIKKLPFSYKTDLRDTYPYGMFAAPRSEIVRVHASSGTTGQPIVVGYTRRDIETWSELMARTLTAGGADASSVIQIAYGYGLFTGGLGVHYGAEYIGATVVPVSGGNTPRQVMLMRDLGATMLACTPSYALNICEKIEEMGVLPDLKLKFGVFGAEAWTQGMRRELEQRLGIRATDIYGLTEVIGPGVSSECEVQDGLHIFEDHFYAEIIDPETGEVLPDGAQGELVFTSLTKEGFPIIRYRTRDLTSLMDAPCPCGRTHRRMRKILGRSDDMLIIRGVNVFPTQVESVLTGLGSVAPHYMMIVERVNHMDTLEVQVELLPDMFSDEVRVMEAQGRRIRDALESTLGISVSVRLVAPGSLARSEGKAKHVIDNRKLD
ncbi:MAG: phenylacetate--CoA ligase family protein [Christensenellales bacterium]|jgi:phenylacetate-CoA ligase